jgi:hypothetical protein
MLPHHKPSNSLNNLAIKNKQMKKYILRLCLALTLTIITSVAVYAQPGFDDDVEDTPIDGGVSLLVGAGIAYGVKRIYYHKKESTNDIV